jgi:hypothetical protein
MVATLGGAGSVDRHTEREMACDLMARAHLDE